MPNNLVPAVVIAVALILAACFGRYEVVAAGAGQPVVYRIDRLTGKVESCQVKLAFAMRINSSEYDGVEKDALQPSWCRPSLIG